MPRIFIIFEEWVNFPNFFARNNNSGAHLSEKSKNYSTTHVWVKADFLELTQNHLSCKFFSILVDQRHICMPLVFFCTARGRLCNSKGTLKLNSNIIQERSPFFFVAFKASPFFFFAFQSCNHYVFDLRFQVRAVGFQCHFGPLEQPATKTLQAHNYSKDCPWKFIKKNTNRYTLEDFFGIFFEITRSRA